MLLAFGGGSLHHRRIFWIPTTNDQARSFNAIGRTGNGEDSHDEMFVLLSYECRILSVRVKFMITRSIPGAKKFSVISWASNPYFSKKPRECWLVSIWMSVPEYS